MAATVIDITDQKKAQDELKASHDQLRDLTKYLISTREQERMRIAQELHDELGQVLTAISFGASYLADNFPESHKYWKSRADATSELAIGAIRSIRRIKSI